MLLKFKPLDPLPACKEDAKKMFDFILRYLNVPIRNITLMCSPDDYNFITKIPLWDTARSKFRLWMDLPAGR